ncbi:PIN domain-like protein [Lichtheimia hyalospora FSU 10163]|nr:PIN domain-like protein [Lichtheimia hyalospora FSU 10163]
MGSPDLLQLVTSIHCPVHIKDYAGKKVAIDGNAWLLECLTANAVDWATNDDYGNGCVDMFLEKVDMLCSHQVTPIIVFQGSVLPCNEKAEQDRRRQCEQEKAQGLKYLDQQKREQAVKHLQKAVHVTWEMIQRVIKHLDKKKIKHIVAPYEVDAQLAHLAQRTFIDAIIIDVHSSDLVSFGCHTTLLFDIHSNNHHATALDTARFGKAKELNLKGWSSNDIRHLCLLSGVQYTLPPLADIDLKAAYTLLTKHNLDMDAVFKHLDDTKYENAFKKLESERFTQQVRDPKSKRIQAFSDKNNTTTTTTQSTQTRAGLGNKTNTTTCTQSRLSSPIAKSDIKNKKDPSAKKSIDHLFSADNKENLPPWLQRLNDTREGPLDRPQPPQPVVTKHALSTTMNNKKLSSQKQSTTPPPSSPIITTTAPSSPVSICPTPKASRSLEIKKRKSVDDENHVPIPKKRGHSSLKMPSTTTTTSSVRRFGLSDNTNQRVHRSPPV